MNQRDTKELDLYVSLWYSLWNVFSLRNSLKKRNHGSQGWPFHQPRRKTCKSFLVLRRRWFLCLVAIIIPESSLFFWEGHCFLDSRINLERGKIFVSMNTLSKKLSYLYPRDEMKRASNRVEINTNWSLLCFYFIRNSRSERRLQLCYLLYEILYRY